MSAFSIRAATPADAVSMLMLLTELADYEKLPIALTKAAIARDFFGSQPAASCDLAFEGDEAVGIAVFFWTYGSFSTKRGLFVEDLFVRPAFRGRGHGRRLLAHLAGKGAARLEWRVLDWNIASIEFYKRLGAKPLADWLTYVLENDAMERLGSK